MFSKQEWENPKSKKRNSIIEDCEANIQKHKVTAILLWKKKNIILNISENLVYIIKTLHLFIGA